MNDETKKTDEPSKQAEESNPGFFKRIFTKIDESMKEKADAKAQDSCCGGSDGKGGKCC